MAARHKNVRLDDDMLALIYQRMIAEDCNMSEAIKSLMQDGAEAPRRRPVVGQVACRKDLNALILLVAEWRRDFAQVKTRLACYSASSSDPNRNAKILKWQGIADRLEAKLEGLETKLGTLVEIMTGLSDAEWKELADAKETLVSYISTLQTKLQNPQIDADAKVATGRAMGVYQAILRALDRFAAA